MFENLGGGLVEINLYPYLTWVFYAVLLMTSPWWLKTDERLFTLFLITLVFETAFLIKLGFFVRPSYVVGLIFVIRMWTRGLRFPPYYLLLFALFAFTLVGSVFLNLDLIGAATSGEARAIYLRPVIETIQLAVMIGIMVSVCTMLTRYRYFPHAVRVVHWTAVAVAFAAIYEVVAIYLHLPFVNLDSQLSEYWYLGFGSGGFSAFRARVTFIEPINLNNFQFFGLACSLAYRVLFRVPWMRYLPYLALQLAVLIGTFSRSTLLVFFSVAPLFMLWYPRTTRAIVGLLSKYIFVGAVVVGAVLFFQMAFNLTPERLQQFGPVKQLLFERFLFMRSPDLGITVFGRPSAMREAQALVNGGRSTFGIGIGNDANWHGGIWGTASIYSQVFYFGGLFGLGAFAIYLISMSLGLLRRTWMRSLPIIERQVRWIFFIGVLAMLGQRMAFSGLLTDTYLWVAFGFCMYLVADARLFGNDRTHRALHPGTSAS